MVICSFTCCVIARWWCCQYWFGQVLVFRELMTAAAGAVPAEREVFTHNVTKNFSQVVDLLSTVPLAAPFYVIIAGAGVSGDGVVIARDLDGPAGPLLRLSQQENSGRSVSAAQREHFCQCGGGTPPNTVCYCIVLTIPCFCCFWPPFSGFSSPKRTTNLGSPTTKRIRVVQCVWLSRQVLLPN